MAQAALKICEICASGPGSSFCLDCEQLFCDSCKSLHTRQKSTKHHKFQDSSDVIPEVKSKCKDHDEDFIFLCTTCDVSVCTGCVVGKHNGHKMTRISEVLTVLKDKANTNIQSKYGIVKENIQQLEKGLGKMEKDVSTAIREITDEGEKIKAMIDQHVQKTIADIRGKAATEKEELTKIISETKKVLAKLDQLEAGRLELQKQRDDAGLIAKLHSINNDIIELELLTVPDLPSVVYNARNRTENEIISIMGSYVMSELKLKKADANPSTMVPRPDVGKEKKQGFLHRCNYCRYEERYDTKYFPPPIIKRCPKCNGAWMEYVKEV